MFTKTKEPMVQHQVQTTTDYWKFKSLDGNRNLNSLHLKRLMESMDKTPLFTVIYVNEKMEVIDGQHRLEACKELGLPINYIVLDNYGLREVQVLNTNSKTWKADDYLDGYCDLGLEDYVKYRDFKNTYNFGHNESMVLLSQDSRISNSRTDFYDGSFKIKDYNVSCDLAEKILMIEPYYDGVRRRSFVYAMFSLLRNENFELTVFLQKLKYQPTALQDCTTVASYKILIEEIYNYKNRNKVNLRY